MEETGDEALMARVARGDEGAFRDLARRHLPVILALARRMTGNAADAEEIAQEAFLRVWIHAPRWQPTARFRTWLYRIVANLCIDRRRRPAFAALDDAPEPVDDAPAVIDRLMAAEADRRVAAALASLPPRQRAALILTFYEELSNMETAAVLETTVSGVEALLIRAKRAMRGRLGTANRTGLRTDA